MKSWKDSARNIGHVDGIAQICPLLAAILAPFSTLFDIPALSQPWYSQNNRALPDFRASLTLSSVGLLFNVIANASLIVRFSSGDRFWKIATHISLACWVIKVILAVVNLAVFGIASRNGHGFSYLEGFWCAVVSAIVSGGVTFFLLFHWVVEFRRRSSTVAHLASAKEVRVFGRHFMLQVTSFVFLLGFNSFIFSRIEGWAYFDCIYFTTVTVLTVGFGDFTPTTTEGRILLFPFCVLLIAQLGNIIKMLAKFLSKRTKIVEEAWQNQYEMRHHELQDHETPHPDLYQEIRFLESVDRQVEMRLQLRNGAASISVFFIFWLVGAIVFWKLEKWSYGDALYFCYVFFLTIGYGDFEPQSNGGRVFFVVYSLVAVPVMASFAVQTITSTLSYISNQRLESREPNHRIDANQVGGDPKSLLPHSRLVESAHDRLHELWEKINPDSKIENKGVPAESDPKLDLAHHILSLATKLEGHARRLLVGHLCQSRDSELVRTGNLLKADWNVQRREVLALLGSDPDPEIDIDGDGKGDFKPGAESDLQRGVSGPKETLEEVREYRECFAELLAAGSRLKQLDGKSKFVFERRVDRRKIK